MTKREKVWDKGKKQESDINKSQKKKEGSKKNAES